MEVTDSPEYLRAISAAVADFRAALTEFLALHVRNTSFALGYAPAVMPRDDADPERLHALRERVGRAAGRAAEAPRLTMMRIQVQGAGAIDPIAAWETMTNPKPLLEPDDVLGACDQMLGRLEAMVLKAEALAPPAVGTAAMHPLVWGAARRLWRDRHYRQAVAAAADALIANVKSITGRNDVAETALWQETFSERPPAGAVAGQPDKPRLRWPGDPADRDVKTMNEGLRLFAPGVQMTVRNPAVHAVDDMTEQEALERLAVLSLLARWVEACELRIAPPSDGP